MRLAGIAGLVAMLLFLLPASVGADETTLEHQVWTYLQANGRYHTLLGAEDDAGLGRLTCGKAGRFDDLVCVIPLGERGGGRYYVSRESNGAYSFKRACSGYRLGPFDRYEDYACTDDITRG